MIGQLRLLARLYWQPFSSMSALLDEGSWLFGAILVILLSGVLQHTLVTKQQDALQAMASSIAKSTGNPDNAAPGEDETIGGAGTLALKLITSNRFSVFTTLLGLMVAFVPAAILMACAIEPLGGVGVVLYRDYGGMATCTLFAWAAAHLPLAALGILLPPMPVSALRYLGPGSPQSCCLPFCRVCSTNALRRRLVEGIRNRSGGWRTDRRLLPVPDFRPDAWLF